MISFDYSIHGSAYSLVPWFDLSVRSMTLFYSFVPWLCFILSFHDFVRLCSRSFLCSLARSLAMLPACFGLKMMNVHFWFHALSEIPDIIVWIKNGQHLEASLTRELGTSPDCRRRVQCFLHCCLAINNYILGCLDSCTNSYLEIFAEVVEHARESRTTRTARIEVAFVFRFFFLVPLFFFFVPEYGFLWLHV